MFYIGRNLIVFALLCSGSFCSRAENTAQYSYLRNRMVKEQIEDRGIRDTAVLRVMRKVERHRFVPPGQRARAYEDGPLPIGCGQTISQPYIVAIMTEVLSLDRKKKVLEIGTGSGYQAAVLAELCDSVFSIELLDALGRRARDTLAALGYTNVQVKIGDGYQGWPEHAPFDAIIVTCSPTHVPQPLQDQLAEGGKMVIPVEEKMNQELILLTKRRGRIHRTAIEPVRFVPMLRKDGGKY
jgi:protein-L-isoaspartate(D-aspartate) O-methyltransferase